MMMKRDEPTNRHEPTHKTADPPEHMGGNYIALADYADPYDHRYASLRATNHAQGLAGFNAFQTALLPLAEARKLATYLNALADKMGVER